MSMILDAWTSVTESYLHELYDEIEELRRHRATALAVARAIEKIADSGVDPDPITLRTLVSNLQSGFNV